MFSLVVVLVLVVCLVSFKVVNLPIICFYSSVLDAHAADRQRVYPLVGLQALVIISIPIINNNDNNDNNNDMV